MFYGGELNVPGAAGNNARTMEYRIPGMLGGPVSPIDRGLGGPAAPIPGMLGGPNTTGAPVGYTSQPTGFIGLPGGIGNEAGIVAGNPSFNINESAGTRKIRSIRRLGEGGVGGEKDAAVEMLKRLGGPQLPQVNVPGAPGNIGGFGENTDYLIAQGKQEQNLINPLDWFSGRNQETINQVQEGNLQGTPSNSPTGQFIKGVNNRNNALNEIMKQM